MRRVATVATVSAVVLSAATFAYAAALTLTSAKLGASAVATPVMFPTSVTVANKAGGTAGKAQNGDIVTLVYSRLLQASTICSSWTNAGPNNAVSLQWSIVNGASGANDTLVADGAAAACSAGLKVGSIDLGAAGYDTSTTSINFQTTSTTITFGTSTTTITATLNGQKNGTAGTVSSGTAALWTPDNAVTDRSGNNCGLNVAKSSSTLQF